MAKFGRLTAEIDSGVWGTPANFNAFRVLAALLHGTLVVGVSQTLRRWTESANCTGQGGHHLAHILVLSFFAYSQPSQIGCLPYFHSPHMVWHYCKFRMQVWNVLHAARWKYRVQKIARTSPSAHHRINLSGYIFATEARIDNRKNNLLNINIFPICPYNMVNFGPLSFGCTKMLYMILRPTWPESARDQYANQVD